MRPTQQMSRTTATGAEAGASQYPETPAPTARPSTQNFTPAKKIVTRKPGPTASYFRRIRDYYQRPRQVSCKPRLYSLAALRNP
uniref:Uncharacterized protein n=1 Tax=Romanomermis culicivorax TaxID=13658 RepID=A0A915KC29_ROMCU